jgi:Ribbon-helix-helix protein, copG family
VERLLRSRHEGRRDTRLTSNYLYLISHRIQITLSDAQYAFLDHEADRTSVSIAELMRRAVETTYGIDIPRRVSVINHTLGRRPGRRFDRRRWFGGVDFD